jgi:hypothetical protein
VNTCSTVIRCLPKRRGYALVMVLLFNVLFLMLLGVAWRQMASVIRIATVREQQVRRDEGSLRVLAIAMQVLETRLCTYNGVAKIKMPDGNYYPEDSGAGAVFPCKKYSTDTAKWYQVLFTRTKDDGTEWRVDVAVSTPAGTYGYADLPSSYP